jgi:hypothetical protein
MIRSGIWRELGLFLAALAVALQIGGMSAHVAHAAPTANDIHLVWCAPDSDQPAAQPAAACPLCQLPQAGGFVPPTAPTATRLAFDETRIVFARVAFGFAFRHGVSPQQPRAPPAAIETS